MQKYAQNTLGKPDILFYCKSCDYGCRRKFLFSQHEKTNKHAMLANAHNAHSTPELKLCICGKQYQHTQSYNRHMKKCEKYINSKTISPKTNDMVNINNNQIQLLITSLSDQYKNIVIENSEMRKIVTELLPKIGNNNNTIINNQFNIQVFLNEECKDALNLTDFIETLKLDCADLNTTRKNGYAEGIANIFLRGLRSIDLHKRPIHCSDLKREILYIKDNNVWEREGSEKKIKSAIGTIAKKQINAIKLWEESHEGWQHTEKGTTEYCEMIQHITSPTNHVEETKIIKSIAKEVIIDR